MDNEKVSGLENPAFQPEPGGLKFETAKEKKDDEVVRERPEWSNSLEFLMSCIAMSVGLGNLWRFPFVAYENGGGAFLIPYFIVLVIVGRPLYYLEMSLGQFGNRGNVKLYACLSRFFKGVAVSQIINTFSIGSYYCSILATTIFYFVNSFTGSLPWGECLDKYSSYLEEHNKTCVPATVTNASLTLQDNAISSSELYFTLEVLQEKTDISDGIGPPEWRLTLCLLSVWIMIFLISVNGIKSSGKASYFLALFPYIIMITLLIRSATLEGAGDGIYYLFKTDWSKLEDPQVWYAALTQCFFSLDIGSGSIIMYASYNRFSHNVNRDSLIVTALDTLTSLVAGITIFGVLGNLAYNLGVAPNVVIKSGGSALAFISYPDAIAKFDAVPWLFSILFFLMLLVLGVGSMVAMQSNINSVILDLFPKLVVWRVSLISAIAGFLIGLMYVTPGGQFMLNLVDYFAGTFNLFIFVILEVIAVVFVYGLREFCLDVEFMTKTKVNSYWRITWGVLVPVLLAAIFGYFLSRSERLTYGPYPYPDGILAIGYALLALVIIQYHLWMVYYAYAHREYGCSEILSGLMSSDDWGPTGKARYDEWKIFKEEVKKNNRYWHRNWFSRQINFLIGR